MTSSGFFALCCCAALLVGSDALNCTTSIVILGTAQSEECDSNVNMCYRRMNTDGTFFQVCDVRGQTGSSLCSVSGNPTSCCTQIGDNAKVICSTTDFGDQPEASDFANCDNQCSPPIVGGSAAMGVSGAALAFAIWRLFV